MATSGEAARISGAFFSVSATRRLVLVGSTHTVTFWRPRAARSAQTFLYSATFVNGRSSRIISRVSLRSSTYSVQPRSVTMT